MLDKVIGCQLTIPWATEKYFFVRPRILNVTIKLLIIEYKHVTQVHDIIFNNIFFHHNHLI